jgi:hypothetical protein
MKTQHWLIALLVFLTCSTVVYAGQSVHNTNHKLDGLTQDDGITALEAGDALGFEVIPRAELEEVRGEGWVKLGIKVLDNAGRVQVVYDTWKYFLKNPSYSTCVYSGTANSTPMYCY